MTTIQQRLGAARPWPYLAAMILASFVQGSVALAEPTDTVAPKVGTASWYGSEFKNRRTASGERFDPRAFTGAHRSLPLGSLVRVTNLLNGRSVLVTITDRGPFRRRREIDLSLGAAREIGIVERGVARVLIEPLS